MYNSMLAISPIPVIAVCAVLFVLVFLTVLIIRMRRVRRTTKNLLRDNSTFVEIEANNTKRALHKTLEDYRKREHYNYASGYIPGAEAELRYLDPARSGEPVETVKVRQTYAPSMQFPKTAASGTPIPDGFTSKRMKPLDIPMAVPPVTPPVLTPVPEVPEIMPNPTADCWL